MASAITLDAFKRFLNDWWENAFGCTGAELYFAIFYPADDNELVRIKIKKLWKLFWSNKILLQLSWARLIRLEFYLMIKVKLVQLCLIRVVRFLPDQSVPEK